ncbi:unnamed protein product [Paramecium primaurelia]|uniref:Uncharacterized protein n=1 Tax=Paramecium primaurelia TaxID=5886 RepID=A0A8S1PRP5_PARPR|nr:unnamed protein product [Paramecium primaurelia]
MKEMINSDKLEAAWPQLKIFKNLSLEMQQLLKTLRLVLSQKKERIWEQHQDRQKIIIFLDFDELLFFYMFYLSKRVNNNYNISELQLDDEYKHRKIIFQSKILSSISQFDLINYQLIQLRINYQQLKVILQSQYITNSPLN